METISPKRKICFVITSNIHYARSKLVLKRLQEDKNVELQIIIGGSAILDNYGDVSALIKKDGFNVNASITMVFEGGSSVAMAKTAGIGVSELATVFNNLKPDIVLLRGDRYEVLSAAIAAAYLNISIAHIEGGDVTGTIDESVRHAVTKLAHIHFATNEDSRNRILRMGEHPDYVFNVGCPEIEFIAQNQNNFNVSNELINYLGVGGAIDIDKEFLIVRQHPVTSEIERNRENVASILQVIHELGRPTLWFWPNVDAGTNDVVKAIRFFRETNRADNIRFLKYVSPEEFNALLKRTSCLVGNSSAGIKECSYLGTPVVNIGTRQNGRMRASNVIDTDYDKEDIKKAVLKQVSNGPYPSSDIYYKPDSSKRIAAILSNIKPYVQKRFFEQLC